MLKPTQTRLASVFIKKQQANIQDVEQQLLLYFFPGEEYWLVFLLDNFRVQINISKLILEISNKKALIFLCCL